MWNRLTLWTRTLSRWSRDMGRWTHTLTLSAGVLLAMATTALAAPGDPTLDQMIENGLSKVVKYVRWGSAGVLAAVFLWAWSQKASNRDNSHTAHQMNAVMLLSGLGFVVVITYKFILQGFVAWTGADPDLIPTWLWQS